MNCHAVHMPPSALPQAAVRHQAKDTLRQPCDKGRQEEQSGSDCSSLVSLPQHAGARKCTGIVKANYVFQSLSYMDFETGGFPLKSGDLSLICLIRFLHQGLQIRSSYLSASVSFIFTPLRMI